MIRLIFPFLLLASVHVPTARAAEHGPVLFFCEDEVLGLGQGGCEDMLRALEAELADFGLQVVEAGPTADQEEPVGPVPSDVAAVTRQKGAAFSVWFTRQGDDLTLHVYDPGHEQKLARMAIPYDEQGGLDMRDVAFRLRSLMGASLYSELDEVVDDEQMFDLAVPQERREVLGKWLEVPEKAEPRTWVTLSQGYLVLGYPAESAWYHGIAIDVAVPPVAGLEIFVDGAAAFPHEVYSTREPASVRIENRQFLVGIGARYRVLGLGPLSLLPGGGFHLGISHSIVTHGGDRKYVKLNPALWMGIDIRIAIVRRFALVIGARFENLFHYEQFEWDGEKLAGLHQFRFGAVAGVLVSI
jgi:hypothetical protein